MAETRDNASGAQLRTEDTEDANDAGSWWSRPAGYRAVLHLAVPLVLSTSSWSIQHFVDRMFLCWYSPKAMAAALPSGFLAFTLTSFFMGTASYANTFVAQYHGAGQPRRLGPAIWQAVYFSIAAGMLLPVFYPFARTIFRLVGHEPVVQELESRYFRIMMLGAGFSIYTSAVSSLFTGLGRNWPVMWVNAGVTAVNIVLDYAMIFGHWGFPEWGIDGAAWATIIANAAGATAFSILAFSRRNERQYATRSGRRFDRELFGRLMRFGAPSGVEFMLDISAFTFFLFIVGRIGTVELAASNLALQINSLAFLPMMGFGIATTTLVGQWLGSDKPRLAARAAWSAFGMTFAYMATVAALYVIAPSWFIGPFAAKSDAAEFGVVRPMATAILRFVAVYCLFDTMNVIFASALKGAGDTRFVMYCSVGLAWTVMVIPTWIVSKRAGGGIYSAWVFLSAYVILLGFAFLFRFLRGKWRTMRVIETPTVRAVPVNVPEAPRKS
jgi:MATE family multidrug resistance protein